MYKQDSAFHFLMLEVFSGFNWLLSASICSKRKRTAKEFFPGQDLVSKQAFFCCLTLAIALQSSVQSVMLWLFLSQ
jgi:hypothetical protein